MFRRISHHLQGDLTYSLFKTTAFTKLLYFTLVVSQDIKCAILFFYSMLTMIEIVFVACYSVNVCSGLFGQN